MAKIPGARKRHGLGANFFGLDAAASDLLVS